jgi:TPR repeat protein
MSFFVAGGGKMPERGIKIDDLRAELKDLRKRGFMEWIDEARELSLAMGCRDAHTAQQKASCFLTLVKIFARDPGEAEILLAAMGLLEGYADIKGVNNRRRRYYEGGYPKDTWENPVDSLRKIEDGVIEEIVKRIVSAADLSVVLTGAPQKLVLPKPQYYKKKPPAQTAGNLPLFVASSFWFSDISSQSEKNQALYRNGYGNNAVAVLQGKSGNGKFVVVSSEYVFMKNHPNSLNDVPQSQDDMLMTLISHLGAAFQKKRIGLSCGHNERVNADNFNPILKQRLSLSGVAVAVCATDKISGCDVFIVGAPLIPFSDDEQDTLEAFVLDGGSVIFCGCGSYWVTSDEKNGVKRKIEDYPINMLGKSFRFRIEAECISKYVVYNELNNAIFFTPIFHVEGASIKTGDERVDTVIYNAFIGNSDAQRVLAEYYRSGNGVQKNYDYSLYWYKMSAFAGNAVSQYYLGCCYSDSFANGIYTNNRLYKTWLAISAKNNELRAISTLAVDTYYGYNGMVRDEKKGLAAIKYAANKGRHNAQYHLGMIYLEQQNYKDAGEWLLKACDSDNTRVRAEAHYQLALLLKEGKGFEKNVPTALHHLFLAAKEGNAKAVASFGQPKNGFFDDAVLDELAEAGIDITRMLDDL